MTIRFKVQVNRPISLEAKAWLEQVQDVLNREMSRPEVEHLINDLAIFGLATGCDPKFVAEIFERDYKKLTRDK